MKVLLVEDESDFLYSMQKLLVVRGHFVEVAEDGSKALERFSKNADIYDVIITDIKMPHMDGLELLKRIRLGNWDTPVILMTGHGDLEGAVQALKYDAFDFLVKPFELKDLIVVLDKLENIKTPVQEWRNTFQDYAEEIKISIQSRTTQISNVVEHLVNHFKNILIVHKINCYKFALCLQEAITNAIVHGNLEVSSSLKQSSWRHFNQLIQERESIPELGGRKVEIHCSLNREALIIQVKDEGNGFDISSLPDPNDPMSLLFSGRGILVIQQFMDVVEWNEEGNVIRMTKWK